MTWNESIRRRLKLRDLHILSTVADAGSMGKAARVLAMSQPAVSKAISDLEAAIGVPMLERTRQGTEPTRYGRAASRRTPPCTTRAARPARSRVPA
jgi:DNA-binding transcriptional LysR family regulator